MRYYFLMLLVVLGACRSLDPVPVRYATAEAAFKAETKAATQDTPFILHPAIIPWLGGLQVSVKDRNILQGLSKVHTTKDTIEFRSFHRNEHRCIRSAVRVANNKPYVDFWILVTYGTTAHTQPTFERETTSVDIKYENFHIFSYMLDVPNAGQRLAHGQGLPIKFFRIDFERRSISQSVPPILIDKEQKLPPWISLPTKPEWIKDAVKAAIDHRIDQNRTYAPFEGTNYVSVYPPATGDQGYFGVYHVLPELYSGVLDINIWRKQLYNEGCRAGKFLNPDGSLVTEEQVPNLVFTGTWFHEYSRGFWTENWIKHTVPGVPWRDRAAYSPQGGQWAGYDPQHWGLGPVCQVYMLTQDPGLAMIIEHQAEIWLMQFPHVQKGTTHHKPGAARARGRAIEAACAMYYAHRDPKVKARLKLRIEQRLANQYERFSIDKAANGWGFTGRSDGVAPWEHGLWVKGLMAAINLVEGEQRLQVAEMVRSISTWLLVDGFKNYNGAWALPYILNYDGSYSPSPSWGLTEWALSAIQVLYFVGSDHLSDEQKAKLSTIYEQFYVHRKGGENEWGNAARWRIF